MKAIANISSTDIVTAIQRRDEYKKKDNVPESVFPSIALAICIGQSDNPIPLDKSLKDIVPFNQKMEKPLTPEELSALIEETNAELIKRSQAVKDGKEKIKEKIASEKAQSNLQPSSLPEEDIREKEKILNRAAYLIENPDEYIKTALMDFQKLHYGDENVCKAALRQQAVQSCPRADGIHIKMGGSTGEGKSSSLLAAYAQSPPEYIAIVSSSPLGVIYDAELLPKTVIMLDDCIPDQPVVDVIKQAITRWREGLIRKTVVNGESKKLNLPSYLSWSLTSCEDVKDEQFQNRFEELHVSKNDQKSAVVATFVIEEAETKEPAIAMTFERTVLQQVMREIKKQTFNPILPKGRLKALRPRETRSIKQLIDNMRGNAILHWKRRYPVIVDGVINITITKADFDECITEFQDTNVYENKLNKCNQAIMEKLIKNKHPMKQSDLVKETGFNPGSIHIALVGRKGDHKAQTLIEAGLVEEVAETEGDSIRTSSKKYQALVGNDFLKNHEAICTWVNKRDTPKDDLSLKINKPVSDGIALLYI